MIWTWKATSLLALAFAVTSLNPAGCAQTASAAPPVHTVTGRVVNGLTGTPIARALVNLNARAVLTDAQGGFRFADFIGTTGYAAATKPGYSVDLIGNTQQQQVADLDAALELKLYPDALITGIVSGPDGLPLERVQVRLLRLTYDAAGPHWGAMHSTTTSARGEYRFEQPAGLFRLVTGYLPRSAERGEAVLPTAFPPLSSDTASTSADIMQVGPGEQRQVNLRPRVGPSYPFSLKIEGGDESRGLRLTATGSTGLAFTPTLHRTDNGFEGQLPAGVWLLHTQVDDRDNPQSGEVLLTSSAQADAQATLQLAPRASIPVQVTYAASSSGVQVFPSFINLQLRSSRAQTQGFDQDIRPTTGPDRSMVFRPDAGHYRLHMESGGSWFLQSATYGNTDLLTGDLVVGSATGSVPIRVVMSSAVARLSGTVVATGRRAAGWVYLVPQQPAPSLFYELSVQPDGSFTWSGAPGHYLAVPSASQLRENFEDPAVLRRLARMGRSVELTEGAANRVDLVLAPVEAAAR